MKGKRKTVGLSTKYFDERKWKFPPKNEPTGYPPRTELRDHKSECTEATENRAQKINKRNKNAHEKEKQQKKRVKRDFGSTYVRQYSQEKMGFQKKTLFWRKSSARDRVHESQARYKVHETATNVFIK